MDTLELKKKVSNIKGWARFKGCDKQTAEDFAQDCATLWLSGKRNPLTPYKYLFADYFKKIGDREGSHDALHNAERFEPRHHGVTQEIPDPFAGILGTLSPIDRIIVKLRFTWGFNLKEIADCLGVSEGRASEIVSKITSNIKTKGGQKHG